MSQETISAAIQQLKTRSAEKAELLMAMANKLDLALNFSINTHSIQQKKTILIEAAASGNLELVKVLLDHGADPRLADKQGNNAFMYAAKNGHSTILTEFKSLIVNLPQGPKRNFKLGVKVGTSASKNLNSKNNFEQKFKENSQVSGINSENKAEEKAKSLPFEQPEKSPAKINARVRISQSDLLVKNNEGKDLAQLEQEHFIQKKLPANKEKNVSKVARQAPLESKEDKEDNNKKVIEEAPQLEENKKLKMHQLPLKYDAFFNNKFSFFCLQAFKNDPVKLPATLTDQALVKSSLALLKDYFAPEAAPLPSFLKCSPLRRLFTFHLGRRYCSRAEEIYNKLSATPLTQVDDIMNVCKQIKNELQAIEELTHHDTTKNCPYNSSYTRRLAYILQNLEGSAAYIKVKSNISDDFYLHTHFKL